MVGLKIRGYLSNNPQDESFFELEMGNQQPSPFLNLEWEGSTTTETTQTQESGEGSRVGRKPLAVETGGILHIFKVDVKDGDIVCSLGKPRAVANATG